MEMYGIILSIPAAFLCGSIYAILIGKIIKKWNKSIVSLQWMSVVILALVLFEVVGVTVIGTLKLREIIGVAYYQIHILLFFSTLPSVVNIMKIQKQIPFLSRWYIIGIACALIGFGIVILQYGVSEALYGINGNEGPYSGP